MTSCPTARGKAFAQSLPPVQPLHRRLYLIRHGQTDWNAQGLMQGGGFDIPLNQQGQEQATRVASELSAILFQVIASSPLQRAMQTAMQINAEDYSIPRWVDDRWKEVRFGEFEGACIHGPKANLETQQKFHTLFNAMKQDVTLPWPGKDGESTLQVSQRGLAAVETLLDQYPEAHHMAVVAHGRFNKILLATLMWKDPARYVEIEQGNTCINVLDYNQQEATWFPILLDYVDHAPNANTKKELHRLAALHQQRQSKAQQEEL